MFRPPTVAPSRPASPGRRGAILIVVLALLALFAVIGLSFVFYADSEALAARYHKEGQNQPPDLAPNPPDPAGTIEATLGVLFFDAADNAGSGPNAMRGHSLMATMYGRKTGSNVPFNGVGTFQDSAFADPSVQTPYPNLARPQWINYNAPLIVGGAQKFITPEYAGFQSAIAPGSGTYIPKNAPYTYPDVNNLFPASLSPATGEVLVPSFHRNWLFSLTPPNVSGGNPDWLSPAGRVKVLRPRPVDQLGTGETATDLDGPNGLIAQGKVIPYPPANADGSFSGDLQNMPGGVGVQKNDSILLDIGLPVKDWNGKKIKPLVAVLVTDLDGLLNLNAHGNVKGAGGNSTSYAGYGSSEVNPNAVLNNATEANALVRQKYGPSNVPAARNGTATLAYDPSGVRLPQHALVNWDGTGTPGTPAVQVPSFTTGNQLQTSAAFPNPAPATPFFDDNTTAAKATNHPGLFNPADWAGLTGTAAPGSAFTYPVSDLRWLRQQYAGGLDGYQKMTLFKTPGFTAPNTTVVGTYGAGAAYRLDPAHAKRLFLTTLSAGRDLPGLMPNYGGTGSGLQLAAGAYHGAQPAASTFVNPPVAGSDYTGTEARNTRAALGPIDLNRPLTDYRTDGNAPSSTNVTIASSQTAWQDRQNLAHDIFVRLVVATGAQGVDSAGNFSMPPATTPEYNALRYLAQIAANAVDTIDKDDVSTPFVWNPQNAADPLNIANFAPTDLTSRVVFGVEKPRLVINEAYGEIVNDPTDDLTGVKTPMKSAQVRFWVELLNPTATPYAGATNGPLGDGSVKFVDGGINPYKLTIVRANKTGTGVPVYLKDPKNVTGEIDDAPTPDIDFNFNSTDVTANVAKQTVVPNNGTYSTTGVAVVGPKFDATTARTSEFKSDPTAAPWTGMILGDDIGTPAAMSYVLNPPVNKPPTATDLEGETGTAAGLRRHVVLLRRLANPYLAAGPTNPYVTVDYMDYVPAYDAVLRADTGAADRTAKASAGAAGFDPKTAGAGRAAGVGKVQPYAGYSAGNATAPSSAGAFPNSFVVAQAPTTPPADGEPMHTFFRHNGANATAPTATTVTPPLSPTMLVAGETIMAPFDWFVHFDRPLANQLELLHVQAVKPHEVTQTFLATPAGMGQPVRKGLGLAPWLGVTAAPTPVPGTPAPFFDTASGLPVFDTSASNTLTRNGLYRAFELLRVKPWTYGTALGGRVHGRVNVNTLQDARLLTALLDPNGGNGFDATEVTNLWNRLINPPTVTAGMPYRTVNAKPVTQADGTTSYNVPTPGQTVDEGNANGDRPFKSFGVAEFTAGTTTGASGLQDTLLRVDPNTGKPLLWASAQTHPYLQAEMARKLLNNVTTVSNVFAVHITVVYHEVRPLPYANEGGVMRPLLGKEAYRETPGDMRQQFFAVVDRSNLLLTPGTNNFLQQPPLFTTVEAAAAAGATAISVASTTADGVPVSLTDGTNIVIGVGANQETVTVSSTAPAGNLTVITLRGTTPITKPHAAGELVANGVAGNPGPQTISNLVGNLNSPWKAVVPLVVQTLPKP